jgi:hypothetical protein
MSTEAQSFADLVRAECGSSDDLDAIRAAFTGRFGPIVLSHFGKDEDAACGVALTDLGAAAQDDVASPARPPGPAARPGRPGRPGRGGTAKTAPR